MQLPSNIVVLQFLFFTSKCQVFWQSSGGHFAVRWSSGSLQPVVWWLPVSIQVAVTLLFSGGLLAVFWQSSSGLQAVFLYGFQVVFGRSSGGVQAVFMHSSGSL